MYFPFLKARQYELLAVRESVGTIVSSERIIPVLEPINLSQRDFVRCAEVLASVGSGFIVVVNPQVGDFSRRDRNTDDLISNLVSVNPHVGMAYWITEGTTIEDISDFFDKYSEYELSLIHGARFHDVEGLQEEIASRNNFSFNFFLNELVSRQYIHRFDGASNVIVEDGFNRVARNADYDEDEFFSDNAFTFAQDGYVGYGDFTIVGNYYSAGGGQAITAAIHFTYIMEDDEEVRIKHFLSEPRTEPEDGATLVSEALPRLVEFIEHNQDMLSFSDSCREFVRLYRDEERTSLAYIKKLSIKHHIELNDFLIQ